MDTKLMSVTLLTLILLASLSASLLSVSEARPLSNSLSGKDGIIREVNGVFRTLKNSGPSPGIGHRLKNLQIAGSSPSPGIGHRLKNLQIAGSGPSPGMGHRLQKLQNLGHKTKSGGPSPGIGHRLNKLQNFGEKKDSGPSPGGGGH